MRTSGPLYLTIIQRPKTEVWYAKSKMGEHKLGSIIRTLAKTLNVEGKRISNHSTRKSVVAKLKKAAQPRHKIIQITGHANECSLDDYDEVDEAKAKGGLCRTLLVTILQHPQQQEVQKHRRARVPCQFLLRQPRLCFRAMHRRYHQQLLFHAHSSNVPSFISDASVTFCQRPSSSTFQQLHCKYLKLIWAAIKKPSQLFTSGMSDRYTCQLSRLRRESYALGVSLTPAG